MKFRVSRGKLNTSAKLVLGAVNRNPSFDILSMLRIQKDGDSKITIESTNMDMRITSSLECELSGDFSICVDALRFSDIVKKLDDSDDVEIEVDAKESESSSIPVMKIKSGKCNFTLQGKGSGEYPEVLQKKDEISTFTMESGALSSAIKKTQFSIYPNETRFNLSGILFHTEMEGEQNFFRAVSTDGHRLSFYKVEVDSNISVPKIIVPKKAILEIRKVLESHGSDNDVTVLFNDKQFGVAGESFSITTKLIAGEYPDYNKVIPSNENTFIFNNKGLTSSIQRVAAIYSDSSESRIRISIQSDTAEVTAKKNDIDFASDSVPVRCDKNETINVCYNYNYLIEILQNISSEEVKFILQDNTTPAIIRDYNFDTCFYVLMSMRDN